MKTKSIDGLQSRVVLAAQLTAHDIAAWDNLCREHTHLRSAFLSPHYCMAVAACHPRVRICVIEKQGQAVGFLPFQFRNLAQAVLGAAERVGEEMTDYFGLVGRPGLQLDSCTMLRLANLHFLCFSHLDETQFSYGLQGENPERGYRMVIQDPVCYWRNLRNSHKNFVTNTERKERQVEARFGPLRFTAVETDWQRAMETLLKEKSAQYLRSGRHDLLGIRWKRNLVEMLADVQEETCSGMLSTLYAGETWLASHFGLRCMNVLHYWFPVYNQKFGQFGPGRLLIKALIGASASLGINTIDHGAGEARYKLQCSNRTHEYFRGTWQRTGLRSFIGRAATNLRWRMERVRVIN
jgi:CelD/BcsL family acetyltransferase involved in cellulose biosynthesis